MLTKLLKLETSKESTDLIASIKHDNLVIFYELHIVNNVAYILTDNYVITLKLKCLAWGFLIFFGLFVGKGTESKRVYGD